MDAAIASSLESAWVFHFTDTTLFFAPDRVTVKVIASPSSASASVSIIEKEKEGCVSPSSIVPFALPPSGSMLTPVPGSPSSSAGLLNTARKVSSSGSYRSSSRVLIETFTVTVPLGKLSVRAMLIGS